MTLRQCDIDGIIQDMLSCLKEYHQYASKMQKKGQGFFPTGISGHCVEDIIEHGQQILEMLPDDFQDKTAFQYHKGAYCYRRNTKGE